MHPIILFIGFFFFAVAYNLIGPLATNIMQTTGLSLTESGSLVSFQQVGALLSMIASLILMKKLKQSTVAKIGYLFLILALTGIAFSTGNIALFIFYLVLGLGTFLIDSGSNATLASDYYEKRSLYIPLLHFCYSAGAIATGYLILPFKGVDWPWAYAMIGIILFGILLAGMVEQKLRRKRDDGTKRSMEKSSPEMIQAAPILPILKDKPFIIYTAVIMLYMGSQVVCAAWIPVYVEIELVQPAAITATSLTVFWVGTAISRLIAGPLMNKGGETIQSLNIWHGARWTIAGNGNAFFSYLCSLVFRHALRFFCWSDYSHVYRDHLYMASEKYSIHLPLLYSCGNDRKNDFPLVGNSHRFIHIAGFRTPHQQRPILRICSSYTFGKTFGCR